MNKNNLILLNCTQRDGGYYNNWNFNVNLFDSYIKAMSTLNVDFIEVGFLYSGDDPRI